MDRRRFMATTVLGAAAGTIGLPAMGDMPSRRATSAASSLTTATASYSAADHRRRQENISYCRRSIRSCMRSVLSSGYLPGQCSYNLGEYPCLKPWNPDEWDEEELDRLREAGIQLIQVHEEWNDSLRLFGGDKFSPLNPAGFRRFVEMVHRRGMKLLVYVSSGFFPRNDPDFHMEWAVGPGLRECYWDYACCSPASPGWRAYLLPRLFRLLDDYGVDGIYNDLGYYRDLGGDPTEGPRRPPTDEVPIPDENRRDGAMADLLTLIYGEVKRRGGIVKIHRCGALRPETDLKVYDYLWVGEGVEAGERLRETVKDYPPYVVPCLDMSRAKPQSEDELYLHSLPYMQFPLLLAGRPFTGQRATIDGIKYPPEEKCFWTRHLRAIWKQFQSHPEGPHSYGWWDSVPGRPEARSTHARWLEQYLPLTEEGTWAWLDIGDSDLASRPPGKNVVLSAFANQHLYLVLANYERDAVEVATRDEYIPATDLGAVPTRRWMLPGRSLHVLRHCALKCNAAREEQMNRQTS
jgi:hypothetical protein